MSTNNSIGALWEKQGKKGEYMSGSVEIDGVKTDIVVFRNTNKKMEKHPDWNILIRQKKEDGGF